MKTIKYYKFTQLFIIVFIIIFLLIVSDTYAQNHQDSSSDLGETMGNVLNEVLQDTLEEALPGSTTIKTPDLYSPTNGQNFTHFPRNVTFTWEQIKHSTYEIELDCLGCMTEGQWNSDIGQSLAYSNNITQPFYNYEFPADRMGRWRVRTVSNGITGPWSEWSFFNFNSGMGTNQQTGSYGDPNSGWGQEANDPYGQDPYQGSDSTYPDNGWEQNPNYPYAEDPYPQDGWEQGGEEYPEYNDSGYEPEQPSSEVPIAEENPNQGAVAPPQAGVPPVQVKTNKQNKNNKSVIKKIPKSVLIKPAEK